MIIAYAEQQEQQQEHHHYYQNDDTDDVDVDVNVEGMECRTGQTYAMVVATLALAVESSWTILTLISESSAITNLTDKIRRQFIHVAVGVVHLRRPHDDNNSSSHYDDGMMSIIEFAEHNITPITVTWTVTIVMSTIICYHGISIVVMRILVILLPNRRKHQQRLNGQNLVEEFHTTKERLMVLQDKLRRRSDDYFDHDDDGMTTAAATRTEEGDSQRDSNQHDDNDKNNNNNTGEVRIFVEGAFDMFHFGHANAFRLARSLGTRLVVGVNSDSSITECKGEPLMSERDRLTMVSQCKFVDEVVVGTPYVMNEEYLTYIFNEHNIDYVVHGDDPCIVNGRDVYEAVKAAGRFRTIPRTEGVSTTDIVGRMLLLTKEHHMDMDVNVPTATTTTSSSSSQSTPPVGTTRSKFLTTTRLIQLFSADYHYLKDMDKTRDAGGTESGGDGHDDDIKDTNKNNNESSSSGSGRGDVGTKVIYIDGSWDMFNPSHVALLKGAKQRGDFLIVGIHSDAVVNQNKGMNLPLLNLHERVLSVNGCRYVDDVLIDAPYEITPDMIASLGIKEVVHGVCCCSSSSGDDGSDDVDGRGGVDVDEYCRVDDPRYRHAKAAGIFHVMKCKSHFKLTNIFKRIQKNQETFQARFERKMQAETNHLIQKYGASTAVNGTTTTS